MSGESNEPVSDEFLPEPASIECWRCGHDFDSVASACPRCSAPNANAPAESDASPALDASPLVRVVVVFAVFLLVSIVQGIVARLTATDRIDEFAALVSIAIAEAFDTGLVLFALVWIARPPSLARRTGPQRAAAWLVSMPVLAALLAVNFAYHWVLNEVFHLPLIEEGLFADPNLLTAWFVVICIQPAVIEELFFRHLALGTLIPLLGPGTAVLISSLMFGLAHVGTPLSIPVLILLGIGLGWARIASGGLMLPIVMHFLHNLVVLAVESEGMMK